MAILVANQHFSAPDKTYVLEALTRFFDPEEAQALCQAACDSPTHSPSLSEMEQIFMTWSREPGPLGVVGKSLLIRLRTYLDLQTYQA